MLKDIESLKQDAIKYLKDHPNVGGIFGPFPNRSCWNCNSAHNHLKDAEYPIECLHCGHIYFKGVQLSE